MQKRSSRVGIVAFAVALLGIGLWRWSVANTEASTPAVVATGTKPDPIPVEAPPQPETPTDEPVFARVEPTMNPVPVEPTPAPTPVLVKSNAAEWVGEGLVVRDDRDRSALPWWNVRVEFADGTAVTARPDANALLRWTGTRSVERVSVDFGKGGEEAWTPCELESGPDGSLLALAPCVFVGRILAVAPGFDPQRDTQILRLQLRTQSGAGVSFALVEPRLERGAAPDEWVLAMARPPLAKPDLADLATTLHVVLGQGSEDGQTWRAEFDLPGLATSPVEHLQATLTRGLRVVVVDAANGAPIAGAIVAIATPKSHAERRVDSSALSDDSGRTSNEGLEPGTYHLFIRQAGYKDHREVVSVERLGEEHVVRLVAKATLHDFEVRLALPDGVDLSNWRVAVASRPKGLLRDALPVALTDGTGAVARFERLPAGEYDVQLLELGGTTQVRAEQVVLVPGSLGCDFNLR